MGEIFFFRSVRRKAREQVEKLKVPVMESLSLLELEWHLAAKER